MHIERFRERERERKEPEKEDLFDIGRNYGVSKSMKMAAARERLLSSTWTPSATDVEYAIQGVGSHSSNE